jgi:hypothetical protein
VWEPGEKLRKEAYAGPFALSNQEGKIIGKGERAMIELTEALRKALQASQGEPVRLLDPDTREEFVLLPAREYDELQDLDYDASPWTDEEMELLASESADMLGWEGMEVYQDPETQ